VTDEREWSAYQQAIFRDVAEGVGHTVVVARAGSGKTSTIMKALTFVPPGLSAFMAAFNKSIADELRGRAPRSVYVSTLHSFGLKACVSAFGRLQVDSRRVDVFCDEIRGTAFGTVPIKRSLAKCVSLAKGCLATTPEEIDCIIDRFQLDTGTTAKERDEFIVDVLEIMAMCKKVDGSIDFDDMVWLPVVHDLKTLQFDRVFIDETQDLNPNQISLALKAVKTTGRICAVGDDRQAIYGFRGADENAVQNVIDRLDAHVLPLSVTYRCAKSITAEARTIVPDIEWAPNAEEGQVFRYVPAQLMLNEATPGDFVLSRANSPLISICMYFLKAGRRANIQGRDIGASLASFVKRSKCCDVSEFIAYVVEWRTEECKRLVLKNRDTTTADDRAETLFALCEGARTVQEVLDRIENLFSDDGGEKIVLSSTHKAKGLERDRVFVLESTYRKRPSVEEDNLYYVAVTRARRSLFLVAS
jgi:DNA helicase-2/ATP-dependent DNA helicase PcrA